MLRCNRAQKVRSVKGQGRASHRRVWQVSCTPDICRSSCGAEIFRPDLSSCSNVRLQNFTYSITSLARAPILDSVDSEEAVRATVETMRSR
jgi:hypothetical protein